MYVLGTRAFTDLLLTISLAYAELNTVFAHLARRFDIINAGTTDEMMDWRDTYTPLLNGHLRVKLRLRE
jgi:cytochrome P450